MLQGNSKQAWYVIRMMISAPHKSQRKYNTKMTITEGKSRDLELGNGLNQFFSCFEEDSEVTNSDEKTFFASANDFAIKEADVKKMFQSCNIHKSLGPAIYIRASVDEC